jgi:hypothetical protein
MRDMRKIRETRHTQIGYIGLQASRGTRKPNIRGCLLSPTKKLEEFLQLVIANLE